MQSTIKLSLNIFVFLCGLSAVVSAQAPALVKDINTTIANSKPRGMTAANNTVFFSATDGVHGRELWKSAGTEASTVLVKDINPAGDANPANFCNVNGIVFFSATTPESGTELWRTDGTAAGTFMVKDLVPGPESSEPIELIALGGKVFFSALRIIHNQVGVIVESKMFVSNGTAAGTSIVEPVNTTIVNPTNFTVVGNNLLFSASANGLGNELWRTSALQPVAVLVNNFTPESQKNSNPRNLTAVGNDLFFSVDNISHGRQIWRFNPGANVLNRLTTMQGLNGPGVEVGEMRNLNGTVFFTAFSNTSVLGYELHKLNSAFPSGAQKITNGSNAEALTVVGSTLFFTQSPELVNAPRLSSVGVNSVSVNILKTFPLIPNSEYPLPRNLTNVNGTLFFSAATAAAGRELWKSNGSSANTVLIQDFVSGAGGSGISDVCARGSDLFFAANSTDGNELRSSNGTLNAIKNVRNIAQGSSSPTDFVKMGSLTFFSADDGASGRELWQSDNTEAGTKRVADIIAGTGSSNPEDLIVVTAANGAKTLFFVAKHPVRGRELFKLENTPNATPVCISDILAGAANAGIGNMTNVNGTLHFTASTGLPQLGDRIFRVNAARSGVEVTGGAMVMADNLVAMGGTLFFTQSPQFGGPQLSKIVGGVTTVIKTFTLIPGAEYPVPQSLTVVGTRLFFTAADINRGRELWVTNPTATNANPISDIVAGPIGSDVRNLVNFNGVLHFTATNPGLATGPRIFKTNPLLNGVEAAGGFQSAADNLMAAGNRLFFTQAFQNGAALSKLENGITTDLQSFISMPRQLTAAGGNIFFTATTAAQGHELWKSNGSAAGTVLVSDIRAGVGNANVTELSICGTDLFFSADNLVNAQEPWRLAAVVLFQGDESDDRSKETEPEEATDTTVTAPEIRVYPNPAIDFVTVDLAEADMTGTLSIVSSSAQILRSVQSSEGQTSIQMDIQDLPRGVYLIRWVQTNGQISVKKLMLQ